MTSPVVLFAIRRPEAARQPGLLKAIQIARAMGASLELFHALTDPIFIEFARLEDAGVDRLRERVEEEVRIARARMCTHARRHGVTATSSVAWDYPAHEAVVRRATAIEREELERRERFYRSGLPPLDVTGRHVVLVDDGIATGSTMLAAIHAARKLGARSVTAAAPVAGPEAAVRIRAASDRVVFVDTPSILFAVSEWYEDFGQLEDIDVWEYLSRASRRHPFKPPAPARP